MTFAPLIISAPFGNYVQPPDATATLGTFTLHRRPGRLWRIVRTVRYYPRIGAWVNRIGLRNPGIDWLIRRTQAGHVRIEDRIVSIHGFDEGEWFALLEKVAALRPLAVELNMSCPNVGEIDWPAELFSRAVATGRPVIVKLPPVNYERMLEQAVEAGVPWLHCCNTLPVPGGGLSGTPLKPVALSCIRRVRQRYGGALRIIGGGGIRQPADVDAFADAGADRFAVGTIVFHVKYLFSHAGLRPLIERAQQRAHH